MSLPLLPPSDAPAPPSSRMGARPTHGQPSSRTPSASPHPAPPLSVESSPWTCSQHVEPSNPVGLFSLRACNPCLTPEGHPTRDLDDLLQSFATTGASRPVPSRSRAAGPLLQLRRTQGPRAFPYRARPARSGGLPLLAARSPVPLPSSIIS